MSISPSLLMSAGPKSAPALQRERAALCTRLLAPRTTATLMDRSPVFHIATSKLGNVLALAGVPADPGFSPSTYHKIALQALCSITFQTLPGCLHFSDLFPTRQVVNSSNPLQKQAPPLLPARLFCNEKIAGISPLPHSQPWKILCE